MLRSITKLGTELVFYVKVGPQPNFACGGHFSKIDYVPDPELFLNDLRHGPWNNPLKIVMIRIVSIHNHCGGGLQSLTDFWADYVN